MTEEKECHPDTVTDYNQVQRTSLYTEAGAQEWKEPLCHTGAKTAWLACINTQSQHCLHCPVTELDKVPSGAYIPQASDITSTGNGYTQASTIASTGNVYVCSTNFSYI